jgi:hypothetical protein
MSIESERRTALAARQLALSCAMVALGALCLSVQRDGNGAWVGTGYASLSVGVVVALISLLLSLRGHTDVPRDGLTALSALSNLLGLAFLIAGVLAPGGGWMFFEALLLVALLSRGAGRGESLSRGAVAVLAAMLLFRLWVTYQGSQHRWQVMTVDVPILSALPFEFLAPVQSISLGAFTPHELGFPLAGLEFASTLATWTLGFALLVLGLLWRARAATEHENDRIHDAIWELQPNVARLVERILPEGEWRELGLQSLSERALRKRIEALVVERVAARREFERAVRAANLLATTNTGGYGGEIQQALIEGERE